jgi:hypothetical protein
MTCQYICTWEQPLSCGMCTKSFSYLSDDMGKDTLGGRVHFPVMYIVITTAKWLLPSMYHLLHSGLFHILLTSCTLKNFYDVHFHLHSGRFVTPLSMWMFPDFEAVLPTYANGRFQGWMLEWL